jgi:hypothetical protein
MKKFILSATVLTLCTVSVQDARAYAPPCHRGDQYIGASSMRDAMCVTLDRAKAHTSLRMQNRNRLRVNIGAPNRKAQIDRERKMYLHPNPTRATKRGDYKGRGTSLRRHDKPMTTRQLNLRITRKVSPAATRQDVRPSSRWSVRTKQAYEKSSFAERRAFRQMMR